VLETMIWMIVIELSPPATLLTVQQ